MSANPLNDCYGYLGFEATPFSITPDTGLFYPGSLHASAFRQIKLACMQGMMAVLSGEIGLGKTLLVRCVLRHLPEQVHVAYVLNPLIDYRGLLHYVCTEFNQEPLPQGLSLSQLYDKLVEAVLAGAAQGQRYAIVIDEAHRLPPESMEMLRMLSNLETERTKLIGLVLVGQPELERTLMLRSMRPLRERIGIWLRLQPFSRSETAAYIAHRIRLTHQEGQFVFTKAALWWLHFRSRGVPRRINYACDKSLLHAFVRSQRRVDWLTAWRACREFSKVWK